MCGAFFACAHERRLMSPTHANEKPICLLGRCLSERTLPMPVETIVTSDYSAAHARRHRHRRPATAFFVLDKEPGRLGRRLATLAGGRHAVLVYLCGILISFALIACLSIVAGLIVTRLLLHVHGLAGYDESLVAFLARHRSSGLTEASLIGSIMAGGVVLPIIAGLAALIALVGKHWRLAGFLLFALAVESGSYRATTLVVHRHRPEVHRLESLPVDASYPSGHTAAAIAVYWGIALLVTSRITNRAARVAIWLVAALIPSFVAFSRMYRGMHHPLDVAGGVLIGIAAVSALLFVTRAARSATT